MQSWFNFAKLCLYITGIFSLRFKYLIRIFSIRQINLNCFFGFKAPVISNNILALAQIFLQKLLWVNRTSSNIFWNVAHLKHLHEFKNNWANCLVSKHLNSYFGKHLPCVHVNSVIFPLFLWPLSTEFEWNSSKRVEEMKLWASILTSTKVIIAKMHLQE